MIHLVRHRTSAGDEVIQEVTDLAAAIAVVERLHVEGEATDVRVFAEVPVRVETVVRVLVEPATQDAPSVPEVEVPAPSTATPAAVPATPPVTGGPPSGVLAPVVVEGPSADASELVDAVPVDPRRGLFHRA